MLSPVHIITLLASNPALPLHTAARFVKKTLQSTVDDVAELERDVRAARALVDELAAEASTVREGAQQASLAAAPEVLAQSTATHNPFDDSDSDAGEEDAEEARLEY